MITKNIISRQPDGSIAITGYDDRDDLQNIIQKHVIAQGNTLIEVVDSVVERPADRTVRDCWDYKNGKIEVDAVKVQAKADSIAHKESKKAAILSKLKITKEELGQIIK